MNLSPPSSQKAGDRPISFLLDASRAGFGVAGAFVDLVIRPEDLTRNDPSRLATQQTLGGAWVDSFGKGVPTITISGHTGWRRREGAGTDGIQRFQDLKDMVFDQWHRLREASAKEGMDPDNVKLIFSDALDNFSAVVAPQNFVLRRNRQRPLLCQYQITMTVVSTDGLGTSLFESLPGVGAAVAESLGLDSLTASVNEITKFATSISRYIDSTLGKPVRIFMNQTARLFSAVKSAITAGAGIAGSLISIANTAAQAGTNLFRTLAAVANIPSIAKAQLMQVAGAFSNVFCVLRNALHQQGVYQDYSSVYGSSNCSSTSGGRALSTFGSQNTFDAVVPTQQALPVSMTAQAGAGLSTLARSDPVLAPMSTASIRVSVTDVANGMVVA